MFKNMTTTNKRIQEFILQATETTDVYNPDTGITHYREFFDHEKFAELIVKECAEVAQMNTPDTEECEYTHLISEKIKEHFGIEE